MNEQELIHFLLETDELKILTRMIKVAQEKKTAFMLLNEKLNAQLDQEYLNPKNVNSSNEYLGNNSHSNSSRVTFFEKDFSVLQEAHQSKLNLGFLLILARNAL